MAQVISCSNCGATIAENAADAAGWRYRSYGVGELLAFCAACERREFAPEAPASLERSHAEDAPPRDG